MYNERFINGMMNVLYLFMGSGMVIFGLIFIGSNYGDRILCTNSIFIKIEIDYIGIFIMGF